MYPTSLISALLVFLSFTALVFIVPPDLDLIHDADAIVIGTVTHIHSEFTMDGRIVIGIDFELEEVQKGGIASTETLRLREGRPL